MISLRKLRALSLNPSKSFFLAAIVAGPCVISGHAEAQAKPTPVPKLLADNPYRFVGRLEVRQGEFRGIGSAVVIKPSSLLTAAHNLYAKGSGWSSEIKFERSYNNGSSKSKSTASGAFILGGYAAAEDLDKPNPEAAFSRDMGGVVCFTKPASGQHATWTNGTPLLLATGKKIALGYGAEINSGEQLLRSGSSRPFRKTNPSVFTHFHFGFEAGMSGGPVFVESKGKWVVCAVNIASPDKIYNRYATVRVVDKDSAVLIDTELK